jgi:uncharacterized membrane protein
MLILFRIIHVLAGVFWVGTAVFAAAFLVPTVRAIGPAGGSVMQQLAQVRKLPLYLMAAMILTLLSGIGLYSRASGGFSNAWMQSGPGMTFGIGGALALIGGLIGMFVVAPTTKRAGALAGAIQGGGKPPSPEQQAEMQRLQARAGTYSALAAGLLVLATTAMAVARYIP